VLVGHSFSGMIVTEAGVHPKVSALVYVAARAPERGGRDYTALAKTYRHAAGHPAGIVLTLKTPHRGSLSSRFRGDLPEAKAKVALRGPGAGSTGSAHRQDHAGGLALETELLCGLHRGIAR